MYVVMDIGCIHCEEKSRLVGIFNDEKAAKNAVEVLRHRGIGLFHGIHEIQIYHTQYINTILI